jgi:hypothetical protein
MDARFIAILIYVGADCNGFWYNVEFVWKGRNQ